MKNKMADNGGWSLTMFLVFLFILLLAILMIAFMVNNVETGLSSKRPKGVSYSEYETYKKYEQLVAEASLEYASLNGNKSRIDINDLEITKQVKEACSGFSLYNSSSSNYNSYLKCGNYKTEGYDDNK